MSTMGAIAIRAEGLGKRFRIGELRSRPTLQQGVLRAATAPLRFLRGATRCRDARTEPEFWALRDVSFEVRQGEALGIIGPNGAGKSTLLKILSRITEPTAGRVVLRGRVSSLLEVGTGFHPELTGRENVFLNGAILGMKKAEVRAKFDEIVAFSQVERFLDTPLKRYSTGMRMRLAFAVAAHLEPEILIIDEVLAVGDAAFQRKCLGKMDEVAHNGRTVIFVSHNMSVVQHLCTRGILLHQGRLLVDDRPSVAVASHLDLFEEGSAHTGDVEHLPRPRSDLGESLRITECELRDSTGRPTHALQFGEIFSVRIDARVEAEYDDLSVVIGIDSRDETRIATAISEEAEHYFKASPHRPLSVVASFTDLAFRPGEYFLSASIRDGRVALDHVVRIVKFTVTEVCSPNVVPSATNFGHLRVNPAWDHIDVAGA
jgi:lipopolysaccharide transport system ATP-binding protein